MNRSPASFSPAKVKTTHFNHAQDSKQIFIYCSQNSTKVKQCFEHHFHQILSEFISNNGPIEKEKLVSLKESNKFELIQQKVNSIQSDILSKLNLQITDIVDRREEFCKVNSKINPKRCMNRYLERDSLAVLNAYQFKNQRLNGHEYIYLKNIIKKDLEVKLNVSTDRLKQKLSL
jgi:hypothetical protein